MLNSFVDHSCNTKSAIKIAGNKIRAVGGEKLCSLSDVLACVSLASLCDSMLAICHICDEACVVTARCDCESLDTHLDFVCVFILFSASQFDCM